jgi:hypothetical protein
VPKKRRTPPPPRPVQSPKARTSERSPEDRRRLLILVAVAASGFVGLGVVALLFAFSGGGGGGDARAALEDSGCTLQDVRVPPPPPGQQRYHVNTPPKRSQYNTWPPSNGLHNPSPVPFDVYSEPVEQYRMVHNLEHGGVVIQYGRDVPQSQVDEMVAWYRDDPNGIVIAPLPELGDEIALAAWTAEVTATGELEEGSSRGHLARCPRFDEGAFDAFLDAYRFKGEERLPEEALQPGS